MATKYAGLRGRIPTEQKPPSAKDIKIAEAQAEYVDRSLLNLTTQYNKLEVQHEAESATLAKTALKMDALDALIQEQLDAQGADEVRMNGYTWSPSCEPYPSVLVKDLDEVKQWFIDHDMAAQLNLNATEMASRLKTLVKEEALANELIIEQVPVLDRITGEPVVNPETGEEVTKTEVRSKVPGVRVYLKESLSRRKSNK